MGYQITIKIANSLVEGDGIIPHAFVTINSPYVLPLPATGWAQKHV